MTPEKFQIISICLSGGQILATLIGFILVVVQISRTRRWNKLHFTRGFIDEEKLLRLKDNTSKYLTKHGVVWKDGGKITSIQAQKLSNDLEAQRNLNAYLNLFENLGTAVNIGAADEKATYATYGYLLPSTFDFFQEYIKSERQSADDEEIYIELEKLAELWQMAIADKKRRVKLLIEEVHRSRGTKRYPY